MKSFKIMFVMLFVLFVFTSNLSAQDDNSDTLFAKIIMKLISFDKNIKRFNDPIRIGITDDGLLKAFRLMAGTKILGRQFTSMKLVLPQEVKDCDVIFIGSSMKSNLDEICKYVAEKKILSFAPGREYLPKGIAIALEVEDNLPVIWMNLVNADQGGSDISLTALKLVMIKGKMRE